MKFSVGRTFMEHEGGTKFYQLFLLSADRRSCAVTHWGKTTTARHSAVPTEPRPVLGGEMQHLPGSAFITKAQEKRKRGYATTHTRVYEFDSETKFMEFCVVEFGAAESHTIFLALGLNTVDGTAGSIDPEDGSFIPSEPEPKTGFDDADIAELTRPESWGSW